MTQVRVLERGEKKYIYRIFTDHHEHVSQKTSRDAMNDHFKPTSPISGCLAREIPVTQTVSGWMLHQNCFSEHLVRTDRRER